MIERHPITRGIGVALAGGLVLSGCAQRIQVAYDPADNCATYRTAFSPASDDEVAQNTAAGALFGGVAGAATGYLIGGSRGALVGGLTGAVVGGVAGLTYTKMNQEQRRVQLVNDYAGAQRLALGASAAQVGLERSLDCRRLQARGVRTAYRGGRISRPVAEAELVKIQGWLGDDLVLAQAYDARLATQANALASQANEIRSGGLEQERQFQPQTGVLRASTTLKRSATVTAEDGAAVGGGQEVRVTGRNGNWYQVEAPGKRVGYVRVADVVSSGGGGGGGRAFIATAVEPIKDKPVATGDARVIGQLGLNQRRQVYGVLPGWYVVEVGQQTRGYVVSSAMRPADNTDTAAEQETAALRATATSLSVRDGFTDSVRGAQKAVASDFTLES